MMVTNAAATGLDRVRRAPLGLLGAVGTVAAFALVLGPPEAALGAGVALAWLLLPAPAPFALGQIAVATVAPADPVALALLEAPLVVVLLGDLPTRRRPLGPLAVGFGFALALGAVGAAGLLWLDGVWQATLAVVGAAALFGYGLHRYTVARFETNEFTEAQR